jgi:integrase
MGKLTAAMVRGRREPGRYGDGHGLLLNVVAPGQRYWMFRFKRDGRSRTMALGNADVITLADARKLHTEARALLAKGIDPLAERERARQAKPVVSFGEAAERYIAAHRSAWRGNGEQKWRGSLVKHVFPVFGRKPVADVTTEDVLRCLTPLWTTKTVTATTVRGRIEMVLSYAKALGWRSGENPALWRGNLRMLLPPSARVHRVEHRAALAWQQAPALFAALRGADGRAASMAERCLQFLLLTAVRSCEARGCRWSEIDLDGRVWVIPASRMKSGKQHRVPLPQAALAILTELAQVRTGDLVFFGAIPGRPLDDTTLLRALRRAGHGDATVHGCRSTFRDWCADQGRPGDLAEMSLAHTVGSAVERSYRRSDVLEQRRGLMQQWADFLGREPALVVPLRVA